jgi:hypothetical protein
MSPAAPDIATAAATTTPTTATTTGHGASRAGRTRLLRRLRLLLLLRARLRHCRLGGPLLLLLLLLLLLCWRAVVEIGRLLRRRGLLRHLSLRLVLLIHRMNGLLRRRLLRRLRLRRRRRLLLLRLCIQHLRGDGTFPTHMGERPDCGCSRLQQPSDTSALCTTPRRQIPMRGRCEQGQSGSTRCRAQSRQTLAHASS